MITGSNTIYLKGSYFKEQSRTAGEPGIYPGMLLEVASDGELQKHSGAGAIAERIVAFEDALQGKTVNDVYTIHNPVDTGIIAPGAETHVLVAAGQNIAIGDKLMSAGNGKFTEKTSTNVVLCVALEAADLTDSAAVDTLIRARWL